MFEKRDFTSHSGRQLTWKIECNSFTEEDWECIAYLITRTVKFRKVYGIPTGGTHLANLLREHEEDGDYPILIVDDVLTTGNSMDQTRGLIMTRDGVSGNDIIGIVVFARNICPDWIVPLFEMKVLFMDR